MRIPSVLWRDNISNVEDLSIVEISLVVCENNISAVKKVQMEGYHPYCVGKPSTLWSMFSNVYCGGCATQH